MTVLISENFDSYNNGDVLLGKNGGTGWGGAYDSGTNAAASDYVFYSSPLSGGFLNSFFKRPTSTLSGFFTISFVYYITNTNGTMNAGIDSNPLNPLEIKWEINGFNASAKWYTAEAITNQVLTANQWNTFDMEINASTGEFRARINYADWSAWTAGSGGTLSTSFNRMYAIAASGHAGFMDNISFTDSPLPIATLAQMVVI